MMTRIKGSYEETREKVEQAARELFVPAEKRPRDGEPCAIWTYVEATFPGEAIINVEEGSKPGKQYRVPYSFGPDGNVVLGEPERVQLQVVVFDEGGETEPDVDDEALARNILPALEQVQVATRFVASSPEVKADTLVDLEAAVLDLLDAMAVKGADVRTALGLGGSDDEDPLAGVDFAGEDEDPMSEAPDGEDTEGKTSMDLDEEDDDADLGYEVKNDGMISLDPEAVAAQIAALQA
jgi:hypothetical protein